MNVKQVLVWRRDLRNTEGHKVRSGKMAAQIAHASMKVFLDQGKFEDQDLWGDGSTTSTFTVELTPEMKSWLTGTFTKVCVSVDSEEELLNVYKQAHEADIPCSLVQDAGFTEFNGEPTLTAVAIGPAASEHIDPITKHLKLL